MSVGEEVGAFGHVLRRWCTDHELEGIKLMKMTLVHTVFRMVNFIRIQRKLICSNSSYVVTCGSKRVRKTPVEEESNSNVFFFWSKFLLYSEMSSLAHSAIHY